MAQFTNSDWIAVAALTLSVINSIAQVISHFGNRPKIKLDVSVKKDQLSGGYCIQATAVNIGPVPAALISVRVERRRLPIWTIMKPEVVLPMLKGFNVRVSNGDFPVRLEQGGALKFTITVFPDQMKQFNKGYVFLTIPVGHAKMPVVKRIKLL
ncbi:hypothetical protein [Paenirhodobacter populi]|uniref:Uncharacterized protein n=1 Tax=Paenirhodobacter populi TaxID=2306993 RepID=A0A443JKL6_9RHOB|nr:hypothetical protein [Sinirhodobacter populi]RWR21135.1 hypothetical protein D2T30_09840 [Sinirhodobacter populi]